MVVNPDVQTSGSVSEFYCDTLSHTFVASARAWTGCFVFATRKRNPYRSGTFQSIIA